MHIRFQRILGYPAYLDFLTEIELRKTPTTVFVDLSRVNFIHPEFMVPFIATVEHLCESGWDFNVELPTDPFIARYCDTVGWVAGIEGTQRPEAAANATFTPLARYTSADELNPIIFSVVRHFANISVFATGVLDAIEWSVAEVADNVLLHAGTGVSGWIQLVQQPKKGLIDVVIADTGRGVCDSLRERYPELENDKAALSLAIEKGVTRNPDIGQGNGLAGTFRIALKGRGWANIHSGNGNLRYSFGDDERMRCERAPKHQGTLVTLTLPTRRPIDVASALWGTTATPIKQEMQYLRVDAPGAFFILKEESAGFGNRASARPLRTKLHNLMNMFPDEPVIVDFADVGVVSASFADEFIARLVKEVGMTTFFSRVQFRNLSSLVGRTIDAVIEQRMAI